MIFFLILHFATIYFLVPLLLGWLLISTAESSAKVQRLIGWAIVALGVWGSITGGPYWYYQASRALATKRYMDARCAGATEKVLSSRLSAEGVVIVQGQRGYTSGSMSRVDVQRLVQPALGRFQRVEETFRRADGTSEPQEWSWQPVGVPEMGQSRPRTIAALTLPYELVVEDLTTTEDGNNRVEGVELRVRERDTQKVIARKVVFAQWSEQGRTRNAGPLRMCPAPAAQDPKCATAFECDFASTFVFQVLEPLVSLPESQLFHLHRGLAKTRYWNCSSDILAAPGISAADMEWWSAGRESWEDLHLRVRGASTELVCSEFHWNGATFRPAIRFADGRQIPTDVLAKSFNGKAPTPVRSLAEFGR